MTIKSQNTLRIYGRPPRHSTQYLIKEDTKNYILDVVTLDLLMYGAPRLTTIKNPPRIETSPLSWLSIGCLMPSASKKQ